MIDNVAVYEQAACSPCPVNDRQEVLDMDCDLNALVGQFEKERSVTVMPKQEGSDQAILTENDLIAEIREMNRLLNLSTIMIYWQMGQMINAFYQGKYGSNELQRIANGTEVGKDTLTKACKFARMYSHDQLDALLKGKFHLSWFQVANNLSVNPQQLIEVYREVQSPAEFHNGIMRLKDPAERRGKAVREAEPAQLCEEPVGIIEESVARDDDSPPAEVYEREDAGDAILDEDTENPWHEIEALREENEGLKAKIEGLEGERSMILQQMKGATIRCDKLNDVAKNYCSILNNIYFHVENGMSGEELFDALHAWGIESYLSGSILKD